MTEGAHSRHFHKYRGECVCIPHEGQHDEEAWRAQGQEGHSGVVVWVPCCVTNNTEKFKVGMEAIKDMSEDTYNFLTKTHSVSDWAASQFKHDHYGVCHCI